MMVLVVILGCVALWTLVEGVTEVLAALWLILRALVGRP